MSRFDAQPINNDIKVILDNKEKVYFPGQKITGTVQITANKEKKVKGVSLKFTGQASTNWSTGSGKSKRTYYGYEEYYTGKVYLVGNGNTNTRLSRGIHDFPFDFTLPKNIPSSFESFHGKVRHRVKAKIIIPWGFDVEDEHSISVNNIYDLNKNEDALKPVNVTEEKDFSFSDGSISLTVKIDRTGFVPGEKIKISVDLNNNSDKFIQYVKMKLVKSIVYRDDPDPESCSRKTSDMTLAKMSKESIRGRGKHELWSNERVLIPSVPPSYLEHCNIIDINYSIQLTASPSGFTFNFDMDVPIIIGTIPLEQHFSGYQKSTNRAVLGAAANSPVVPRIEILQPSAPPTSEAPVHLICVSDVSSTYDPMLPKESETPSVMPVFPGFEQYPEMPSPVYSTSQHSVHMEETQQSSRVPQGPFIPSYVTFNPPNSRPGTPYNSRPPSPH